MARSGLSGMILGAAVGAVQALAPFAPASANGYAERPETAAPAPARACPKMCPQDASPCDPIQFKIADGRCPPPFSFGRRF